MPQGRADAVVKLSDSVYIFEFKLFDTAQSALEQIRQNAYHEKYAGSGKKIILVGAEFEKKERNLGKWLVEEL